MRHRFVMLKMRRWQAFGENVFCEWCIRRPCLCMPALKRRGVCLVRKTCPVHHIGSWFVTLQTNHHPLKNLELAGYGPNITLVLFSKEMALFQTPRITKHFRYRSADDEHLPLSGSIFSKMFLYRGADIENVSLSDVNIVG